MLSLELEQLRSSVVDPGYRIPNWQVQLHPSSSDMTSSSLPKMTPNDQTYYSFQPKIRGLIDKQSEDVSRNVGIRYEPNVYIHLRELTTHDRLESFLDKNYIYNRKR